MMSMNDMSQTLIERFCEENLCIYLQQDEDEFIRNFDFSLFPDIIRDDNDYHVVDGEEGDYGEQRYYTNETKEVLLATYINKGGDEEYWEFTKMFVERAKFLIHEIIEIRMQKHARPYPPKN